MHANGRVEARVTAPVLLLGLGNPLMADDGAGQKLLSKLSSRASELGATVEFMDGGTEGLALVGALEGRKAVVFLDAVRLGDKPGAIHVLRGQELHDGRARQILEALESFGQAPDEVVLVGVEPERIEAGVGLSPAVEGSLGMAAGFARMTINRLLMPITERRPRGRDSTTEKVLV